MTILLYDLVGRDASRPFSPHCWKAAMALAHKGLDFEKVPTPFTAVPGVEGGISKIVPVIRDGDKTVSDSFAIALYLEDAYPDRPTLFGGDGGKAMARFIERWSQLTIHTYLGSAALKDIHDVLAPEDQAYFRKSREARFGKRLEEVPAGREAGLATFRASLEPLRSTLSYQPWIGGASPLFADYIVYGAFQWVRIISPFPVLAENDPVAEWFGRCLDLHGGIGRKVPAAA
ncbi:glutathione S-transferase family protein [Allomesorhizobium alhagi]|jgi:glutathione S-transferase|uniref:Glutathione S-transferase domain-containing protein n=1 Tax=Mesorhizobium alhagi CCNWXJ12-2 TaxID=1107882 RepID=H0HQG0_9HYPH|nr:glutathione S-transferase family protein [Mesorhizobium alhagi]EHK57032.1 glutathione S-transferase domain-containing protein [Mesorhizobium alhagi CCNWXJ12-2]